MAVSLLWTILMPRLLLLLLMMMVMMMLQRHVAGHGSVVAVDCIDALAGGCHGVGDACSLCRALRLQ